MSDTALTRTVLCAPSVNIEASAYVDSSVIDALILDTDGMVVRGQKTPVRELIVHDAPGGKGRAASITLGTTGHRCPNILLGNRVSEVTSGSSVNLANALALLGCQDVGIIGAVGRGAGRQALTMSLDAQGIREFLFFRRKGGTARSLFLREPSGAATGFSWKDPYDISAELLAQLTEQAHPMVLACTGFLEYELPLVHALWAAQGSIMGRALSPHVGCFAKPTAREQCLKLAATADLFQLNEYEIGKLLGYGESWILDSADLAGIREIGKRVGSRVVCITRAEQGSVAYDRERDAVIVQPAFPAQKICNTVGAGDVHLASLMWYLWLRGRSINLAAALELAGRICATKIVYEIDTPRPWDGIPDSNTRKPWVREAETRHP